jgi:hypothetical protein
MKDPTWEAVNCKVHGAYGGYRLEVDSQAFVAPQPNSFDHGVLRTISFRLGELLFSPLESGVHSKLGTLFGTARSIPVVQERFAHESFDSRAIGTIVAEMLCEEVGSREGGGAPERASRWDWPSGSGYGLEARGWLRKRAGVGPPAPPAELTGKYRNRSW